MFNQPTYYTFDTMHTLTSWPQVDGSLTDRYLFKKDQLILVKSYNFHQLSA